MASRIVLFGATGYTGDLTARALVEPVATARSWPAAREHKARARWPRSSAASTTPSRTSAGRSRSRDLVERDDVLVTTVGPFARWGEPALRAAVDKGAHYLDSTGEPPFIRGVFETWGPRAKEAGVGLLTAMGYDYVPGNLAGALALRDAGPKATSVDVGYFALGPLSSGRRQRRHPRVAHRRPLRGRLPPPRRPPRPRARGPALPPVPGPRPRSGRPSASAAPSTTRCPLVHPGLRDVGVYLGWFGPATPITSLMSRTGWPRSPRCRR